MIKFNRLRGASLAIIGAALAVSACATQPRFTDYHGAVAGSVTPEQSAVDITSGVSFEIYTGYDENGHIRPARDATSTESVMMAETELHCAVKVQEVDGLAKEAMKNGVGFTAAGALAYAAAAAMIPGADVANNAIMGGAGFAGSSVATTGIIWDQNLRVYYNSCVANWVGHNQRDPGDRRLRDVMVHTLLFGQAPRPRMGSGVTEPSDSHDYDDGADQAIPPMPIIPR